jgi:heme-degrading monooxygenase HmoA
MAYVIIEHRPASWSEFERLFRRDSDRRRTLGSKSANVLRSVENPETVFVVFEWANLEDAKKFADEWDATSPGSRIHIAEELFEQEA